MRSLVRVGVAGATIWLAPAAASGQIVGPSTGGAAALAQAERMLGHTKRVLMIAAHPDDEDTELLTYLVRREGAVAAYLSLTRGEGGQNLIGPELGEALGIIRSEELLAARALDGARQYFTRAFDFGYSKSLAETFRFWPRDSVLKDVVRIVRRFRPQVIVSVFSGTPRDGHGQHQAAGWAAHEAFRVAADPNRFSELEQDEGLTVWAPSKLYRAARFDTTGTALVLRGGLLDHEIGQSYRQIAMRGRSLHRSQDMGVLQEVGPSPIRLALVEDRAGGGPELFQGIDTTARSGGVEGSDLEPHRAVVEAGRAGIVVDAIADASNLVPGMDVRLRLSVWNTGLMPAVARIGLAVPDGFVLKGQCLDRDVTVEGGAVQHCPVTMTVAAGARPTEPYFLEGPRIGAFYRWAGPPANWGEPFDPPFARATFTLGTAAGDPRFILEREIVHRFRDQAVGEVRRPLAIVSRVDVKATPTIKVWSTREMGPQVITVAVQHAGPDSTFGTVSLDLPRGWSPVAGQPFRLVRPDERRSFSFQVRAPVGVVPGAYAIRAFARDDSGRRYDAGAVVVSYPHVRERRFSTPSTVLVHAAPVALPKRQRIGYVRGASDLVPEALAGVGLAIEVLDAGTLERGNLARFDAIVVGSRAYETDPVLAANNGRLLDYARQGGHLLVQYQQQPFFDGNFAPYALTVGRPHDRVTDEVAPVRVLKPNDQVFRFPNRIVPADWTGWIQERGLYFARTWAPQYTPLIEAHDNGDEPLEGGLLVARYGKGTYVYSGLAFFRQLAGGVPGAFRLFMNLLDGEPRAALP